MEKREESSSSEVYISREWLYTKILDASQKKYHGKLCGVVLAGGSGAGKTTFASQLSVEKIGSRKHTLIRNKLVASYLIPASREMSSRHLVQFLNSVYTQLCESNCLVGFRRQEDTGWLREAVDDPDEIFKKVVLFPLLECEIKHKVVIFLVDGLNLELLSSGDLDPDTPSRSIPEILSRHAHLFPRWLLPVFTTRQSTAITAHFPGFRRISIDDLRKTQVIQDIQQLIIARLQVDRSIAKQVTKESTELLSLLHVKSAGCFLYIKKVLDGISEHYITLEEIREIPGTLNGLYLWLCQKQFNKKNFPKVRPLINILLASSTLTQPQLYQILSSTGGIDSLEEFNKLLVQLRPMLSPEYRAKSIRPGECDEEPVCLYHYSLAEWFLQPKFCGPLYECKLEDGQKAIKEWNMNSQQNIYDKPDLVSGIENQEEDSEIWMLVNTEERERRKQSRNAGNEASGKLIQEKDHLDDHELLRDKDPESHGEKPQQDQESHQEERHLNLNASQEILLSRRSFLEQHLLSGNPITDFSSSINNSEEHLQIGAINGDLNRSRRSADNLDTYENVTKEHERITPRDPVHKTLLDFVKANDSEAVERMLLVDDNGYKEDDTGCKEDNTGCKADLVVCALQAAREGFAETLETLLQIGGVHPDSKDENGWTLLRTAAWAGKEHCVKVLVDHGASVNQVDDDMRTALRAACWAGHLQCVYLLLNNGAEVNQFDSEGRTAMIAACYMGHIDCVRELIIWGADIEAMDQDGRTALSVAVTCESESAAKLVTLLIDNGANPNQSDKDGMSPLLIAAFEGKAQVCEILLENSADMDHADKEGKTALFAAASMGHLNILNILLFWGCYVDGIDCEGRTVLSVAAAEGSTAIVKVLLDRGLDEQHRDNAGWGPLHYAAFEGHSLIVDLLINAGAELDMVDCDGKTALHLACSENHYEVVVQLLRARADVNIVNLQGRTPLRISLLEGSLDIAGILLDNGADIDYMDTDSRSTLYIMALENDAKSVEFLLNHGANTELRDSDGRTALHVAAWQGYTDIVQVLLLNGADVNCLDGGRRSALLSACWQGHLHIVDILLTAGADVNQQCDQGASPLAVSAQEGHIAVLQLMLQHGADPLSQDHHGRDALRVALRNNNAIAAELLEKYIKRMSDSRAPENLHRLSLDDDPGSPLYASPTAYGYGKIGAYSRRSTPARSCSPEPASILQDSEFTFNQTGHMAIILGRANPDNNKPSGLFENIKEKARNGFSATKRNFL